MIDSDQFPIIKRGQGRYNYGDMEMGGIVRWGAVMFCLVCIIVAGVFIAKAFGVL